MSDRERKVLELLDNLNSALSSRNLDSLRTYYKEARTILESETDLKSRKRTCDGEQKLDTTLLRLKQFEETIRDMEQMLELEAASNEVINIQRNDLCFLKSMRKPPRVVLTTLIAFFKLLGNDMSSCNPEDNSCWERRPDGVLRLLQLKTSRCGNKLDVRSVSARDIPIEDALWADDLLGNMTYDDLLRKDMASAAIYKWCRCMISEVKKCGHSLQK